MSVINMDEYVFVLEKKGSNVRELAFNTSKEPRENGEYQLGDFRRIAPGVRRWPGRYEHTTGGEVLLRMKIEGAVRQANSFKDSMIFR